MNDTNVSNLTRLQRIAQWTVLLGVALAAAKLAGCAGGGGGGGSPPGASPGVGPGGMPAQLRLVALDRRALSPSASPRLLLFVERPAAASPSAYVLEESADGTAFAPSGAAPARVLAAALHYELPLPAAPRFYRVAAPAPSNVVRVDPAAAAAGAPAIVAPGAGATGVARLPALQVSGGPGARTFLYAIADEEGTIAWLAESADPRLAPGAATAATTFIATAGLAANAPYLATVVALDGDAFGAVGAAAARVDFTTAP